MEADDKALEELARELTNSVCIHSGYYPTILAALHKAVETYMTLEQDAKRFVLVLAPVSPWPKIDPVQRLRAALKRLKRDYGLRCVECKPVEGKPKSPAGTSDGASNNNEGNVYE